MSILDRIGDLYEEQRALQARSGTLAFRDQDRARLVEIAAALESLWEARRIQKSDASETARLFAFETMQANARAVRTLAANDARARR